MEEFATFLAGIDILEHKDKVEEVSHGVGVGVAGVLTDWDALVRVYVVSCRV